MSTTDDTGSPNTPDVNPLAPIPTHRPLPDAAYHRSPTLLASESGGSPDQVQVWAPNNVALLADAGVIRIFILLSPFMFLISLLVGWQMILHPSMFFSFNGLFSVLICAVLDLQMINFIRKMPSLRNKVYITTDASGIAIRTHKRETRAIYWKDIRSLELGEMKITLRHPEPTEILLRGYSAKLNKQLLALIKERAKLVPTGRNPSVLVKMNSSLAPAQNSGPSVLWNRFTEKAKRTILGAEEEAKQCRSSTVEPEHLLLTLMKDDNDARRCLVRMGVSPEQVRDESRARMKGFGKRTGAVDVQLSPTVKKALDNAYHEAKGRQQQFIATEHLLLGILGLGDGIAFAALSSAGVTQEAYQKELQAMEDESAVEQQP